MYLALRPPWAGHAATASDGGVVAEAPSDGGVGKKKKKRRPGGGGGHVPGPGGEDEDWLNSGGGEETEPPKLIQLSAGDRAMEWRGDDTTPPKQTIDMNSGGESRSLDNGEIQNTIASESGSVQSCVIKAATFEGMTPRNTPTPWLVDYHRAVAAGGVGMTTVAFCCAYGARS